MASTRRNIAGTGAITSMKHLPVKENESDDRMDQEQAMRFLKSKEYLVSNQPDTTRLRGEAVELAVNISDSFSPDFRRYFVACEDSGEYDACFSIIRYLYQIWHVRMPRSIRAFAAIQEVWKEFLRITAQQVNLLHASELEGEPLS